MSRWAGRRGRSGFTPNLRGAGLAAAVLVAASVAAEAPRQSPAGVQIEDGAGHSWTFTSCSEWGSGNRLIEQQVEPGGTVVVPGGLLYPEIECRRGVTGDTSLAAWRAQVASGSGAERPLVVTVHASTGTVLAQWMVAAAWPARLDALLDDGAVAVEQVVLVAEGVVRIDLPPGDALFADGFDTGGTTRWSVAFP